MKATILYAWELGGGLGHLWRFAPLAERLVARGHRVVAAVRELKNARHAFARTAVEFLPAPHLNWSAPAIDPMFTYAEMLHNVGFGRVDDLRTLTAAWRTAFRLCQANVIVCDHCPTGMFAAALEGISCANLGTGFTCPPGDERLPVLRWWEKDAAARVDGTEERLLANVNELRAEAALAPWERLAELYASPAETFLTTFAELDHLPDPREPVAVREGESPFFSVRLGSPQTPGIEKKGQSLGIGKRGQTLAYRGVWESVRGAAFEWPPGDGPRVFLYTHRFAALGWLLDHLRNRGWPTVACVQEPPAGAAERVAGSTLRLTSEPLNIRQAAAECDFAVLNAGHNATAQFMLASKPLLLLPISLEQGMLTRRLCDQGLAVSAGIDSPAEIQAGLNAIANEQFDRRSLRDFAAKYAGYDAQQVQAEIIDALERQMNS